MPYAQKLVNVIGILAKEEVTPGTPVVLSGATDGLQPWFTDRSGIPVTLKYSFDGKIGPAPGGLGNLRQTIPFGAMVSAEIPFFFKGPGVAYSASIVSLLHRLHKASGFDATGDFTASAEKWTYTPTLEGTVPTTLTVELYTDGEVIPLSHVMCNWKFSGDTNGIVRHTFTLMGIKGIVADAAPTVPAGFTYPLASVIPTSFAGSTLTLGSWTAVGIKSVEFDLGRVLEERPAVEPAVGHLGFVHRGRNPRLSVVVEKTPLVGTPFHTSGGLDPYKLYENATSFAATLQHAGAQYSRWKLVLPQLQVIAVPERQVVNGVAGVKLDLGPYLSTPVSNDDLSVVKD